MLSRILRCLVSFIIAGTPLFQSETLPESCCQYSNVDANRFMCVASQRKHRQRRGDGHYADMHNSVIHTFVGYDRYDSQGEAVSYTHLRAHETRHDLVCRLLLEKTKKKKK